MSENKEDSKKEMDPVLDDLRDKATAQVLKPQTAAVTADENVGSSVNLDDPEAKKNNVEGTAAISQSLQNLSMNTDTECPERLSPFAGRSLANLFLNVNLPKEEQDGIVFDPFVQGIVQRMLSKEVLYPSAKEIADKYPDWLKENKSKIDPSEYERFEKQHQLIVQVCTELEEEQESDFELVHWKRFQRVISLMEKLHDLGPRPSELVGDISALSAAFAPSSQTGPFM